VRKTGDVKDSRREVEGDDESDEGEHDERKNCEA
jgi:hypothetical protein